MEPTVDILATLGVRKAHQILVGFAAETHTMWKLTPARSWSVKKPRLDRCQ